MKKYVYIFLMILLSITLISCKRKDNVLRVGMDLKYPPFETIDNNQVNGISVDIAKALGKYLNMEVEIVNTNFASLIPSLHSKEIDLIISSMSITKERSKVVDFEVKLT